MTNPKNWPDPARPGVPLFPERDGWHIVKFLGVEQAMKWNPREAFCFWVDSGGSVRSPLELYHTRFSGYIGSCLTPTQISEMLAEERNRCAKECDDIEMKEWRMWKSNADMFAQGASDGAMKCAHAIRNMGAAP